MPGRERSPSWRTTVRDRIAQTEHFHALVAAAIDELPEQIRARLENVEIVIEDEGAPGTLGLYQGIPQPDRDSGYAGVLPDLITIYRLPIEARARDEETLAREVRRTVHHEIAHHFGISDERLREIDRY